MFLWHVYPGCGHFDNGVTSKIDDVLTEHGILPLAFLMILVSAPVPLGLILVLSWVGLGLGLGGLGTKGFRPGLDNWVCRAWGQAITPWSSLWSCQWFVFTSAAVSLHSSWRIFSVQSVPAPCPSLNIIISTVTDSYSHAHRQLFPIAQNVFMSWVMKIEIWSE